MKKDNKKALYEAIMTSVAKEVKKVLNEEYRLVTDLNDLDDIIAADMAKIKNRKKMHNSANICTTTDKDELRIELESLLKKIRRRKFTFDEPLLLEATYTNVINIDKYGEMQDAYDREITQNIFDWFDEDIVEGDDAILDIQKVINALHKGLD